MENTLKAGIYVLLLFHTITSITDMYPPVSLITQCAQLLMNRSLLTTCMTFILGVLQFKWLLSWYPIKSLAT